MAEEYTPPEWPRFLFKHGEAPRQFNSEEEAEQAGGGWHRTQEEADKAHDASQQRQQSQQAQTGTPPVPELGDEDQSPGDDRPHTPRSRR